MEETRQWPTEMTREQRRLAKERQKEFEYTFKECAKGTGWRFSRGSIYREDNDWFLASSPFLNWQQGITHQLCIKPMSLDVLFWEVVNLEENNDLPLSFRQNGAWVLKPPRLTRYENPATTNPKELANLAFAWTKKWHSQNLKTYTLDDMLKRLQPLSATTSHLRALAICLLILKKEYIEASALIKNRPDDSGGFSVMGSENFYDMAKKWLAKNALP